MENKLEKSLQVTVIFLQERKVEGKGTRLVSEIAIEKGRTSSG